MTLKVYSSIKELPIRLTKEANRYMIQDIGIGSNIESIDSHLGQLLLFLSHGKVKEAFEEAKHLRLNLFSAISKMDFKCLSMLCMIHSKNGVPVTDYTEDGLLKLADELGGYPIEALEKALDEVKKNLIPSEESTSQDTLQKI
jgi:hypothetical protein